MKKALSLVVILFLSTIIYGQSTFRPTLATTQNFCVEFDIIAHSEFVNKFGSANLRFLRFENTLTTKWLSAYCDCELCRLTDVDSADFFIDMGDSCTTSAHFYPDSTKGTGLMKIKIYDPKDRANFVVGQYKASCWSASSVFLKKEQLEVYPNPTNSALKVQFGSGEPYLLQIVTMDGRLMMKEKVDGLENNIDVSGLNPGMYAVKIETKGKVFYSRFIKS